MPCLAGNPNYNYEATSPVKCSEFGAELYSKCNNCGAIVPGSQVEHICTKRN